MVTEKSPRWARFRLSLFSRVGSFYSIINMLVLWHNMRVFQRGKRAGQSPFQWAGITTSSDDWLALLGYPAN